LITLGRRNAPKGEFRLSLDDLSHYTEGLLAGVLGEVAPSDLGRYRELFQDRCYLFTELHRGPNDERKLQDRITLAKQCSVPRVPTNEVHFHAPCRRALVDVLTATKHGCTIHDAGDLLFPNAARHLKPPEEMQELFAMVPDAIRRTVEIANRCIFSLD